MVTSATADGRLVYPAGTISHRLRSPEMGLVAPRPRLSGPGAHKPRPYARLSGPGAHKPRPYARLSGPVAHKPGTSTQARHDHPEM